jgi:hypothetical protein
VYLPAANRFGVIKIQIISAQVKGIFEGKEVETELATFFVPIPFLNEAPYNSGSAHDLEVVLNE